MSVRCRAPAAATVGSGRYSSRPPAATARVTDRTDSCPLRPGSATAAATVRTRSARPFPHLDPQFEDVTAEGPGGPANQVHRVGGPAQDERGLGTQDGQPGRTVGAQFGDEFG